jgi:nucleoside-diphosphate-sugar epimerase
MKRNLVTGATGLLGSHIAEQLRERGEAVRALVRPTSDRSFLEALGVECVEGDLAEPRTLPGAVEGAELVYHCAARVGDWGSWSDFRREVIEATGNLLEACQTVGIGRFLHVSSITVYGHPRQRAELFTEEEPLGQNPWLWGDYYCQAKIQAEERCRAYPGELTIIRPGWMYGPRDRTTLPRILKALAAGRVGIIGKGDNLLNIIYVGDIARGAILAANAPVAAGRAYNLASAGDITQREFLDALTEALGVARIRRHFPYRIAFWGGFLAEIIARVIRLRRPPHISRYVVALVGRSTRFSSARARTELGWQPVVPPLEGLRQTLEWYWSQYPEQRPGAPADVPREARAPSDQVLPS